jgi:uncharacterized protein YjbI with pentapeptide repeats
VITMNKAEFDEKISDHEAWLKNESMGHQAYFENERLNDLDLSNRVFCRVEFSHTQFRYTNLTNVRFYNCVFDDCNFKRAKVFGVYFIDCDNCNLTFDREASGVSIMTSADLPLIAR